MISHRSLRIGALVVLLGAGAAAAAAQPPAAAPLTAGWQDGFFIQTADGDFRLALGLTAQADGRFVVNDAAESFTDTFTIRKVRPTLSGRMARYIDFLVMPDFGNGTTVLQDAYLDLRFGSALRVRTGKSKTPIGYEILMGDPFLLFPERALASGLVPNRDVGVQALGDLAGGRLSYAGGVFNGIPDGASSASDLDANEGKELAGRLVVQPFRRAANPGPLNMLGFALGGSRGDQRGPLPSLRTTIGQRYFGYAAATSADGPRTRVTPSVFYYHQAAGVFGEYMRSTQDVAHAGTIVPIANRGWQVTGLLVLTGEAGADRGVRPRAPFDPAAGSWGALQLVARYSAVIVDRSAFDAGLAAAGSSQEARAAAVGLNWYPAYFIKYYAAFERTNFEGGLAGARMPEHSFVFRAQVAF